MLFGWTVLDILTRNWAIVVIASTIVALVAVPALVLLRYVRIALNIMRTTTPPLSRSPLDFERLAGEAVEFNALDGSRLVGTIIRAPAAAPRRGIIVFSHEFCADMHSCARYCRPLNDAGYDIFTFDYRGHGQSPCPPEYTPRQWVTNREVDDIRGAVAFVHRWLEMEGRPPRVGLFGISRGAGASILLAAEDPSVGAVLCDGVFSTDTTIESLMKRWAYIFARIRLLYETHPPAFWKFLRWWMMRFAQREFRCRFPSVRRTLEKMSPRPMFFIHGEKDSYLPIEQCRLLYAIAGQPKYFWMAPGAKHNQAAVLWPERYAALSLDFFERHLGGNPPERPDARPGPPENAHATISEPQAQARGAVPGAAATAHGIPPVHT